MVSQEIKIRGHLSPRERLIVALDVPGAEAAARLAERLRSHAGAFKVGLELFACEGPALVRNLVAHRDKIFLDLKFHDIPNTVRAAARKAAGLGVFMLDVHASGGRKMMQAALEGVADGSGSGRPLVLAVTVLTSLASCDLGEIGMGCNPDSAVIRLASLAQDAGLDGVVASPREVRAIRAACGPDFVVVAPGIRPPASSAHDQARIATPEMAIEAGADYLVVGRPITEAEDPAAAADAIVAAMGKTRALSEAQAQNL